MDETEALKAATTIITMAIEERRGLVAYTRLEVVELDRRARVVEREALEQLRSVLPAAPFTEELAGIASRLGQMEVALQELASRSEISERSRALEQDDIRWRAFEDISWVLELG